MGTVVLPHDLSALAAGNQPLSKIDANFDALLTEVNGNLTNVNVPGLDTKEGTLGNPTNDFEMLQSTKLGVRSWKQAPPMQFLNRIIGSGVWGHPKSGEPITVYIEMWGAGGGGGGGGSASVQSGSGGGGGAYSSEMYTGITGDITVTIGVGGTGGSTGMGAGANGGDTQVTGGGISPARIAGGGTGGQGGAPGNGGVISGGGDINIIGGDGQGRFQIPTLTEISGAGGDSPRGGAGGAAEQNVGGVGRTPGGGGGGGYSSTNAGGDGAGGMVVIWWGVA